MAGLLDFNLQLSPTNTNLRSQIDSRCVSASFGEHPMLPIDDGFADAKASQISLMNNFTVVYEDSAIKNTPDGLFT